MNGQANYDIENDMAAPQMNLFTGEKALTKIERFQRDLEIEVLAERLDTNLKTFIHTLSEGHISAHAEDVLKKLKGAGKIEYEGRTGISYNAYKEKRVTHYKTKKK